MSDTIYRQAALDALAKEMPSLTTPDGSGEFDHDIQIADEAFVDCMQIINALPPAQPVAKDINVPVNDTISRQDAIDVLEERLQANGCSNVALVSELNRSIGDLMRLPSAQPERLTDDDFETIRIHLSAYKETLCNQRRWKEAEEYQRIIDRFMAFASAQPEQRWIPTSEKLPDELAEVNVTWENTEPESYYDFVKGHYFTGTAVYFRGRWYWYSAVCVDYLREYGFSQNDEMDDAIKVLAWMPLPEPYERRQDESN